MVPGRGGSSESSWPTFQNMLDNRIVHSLHLNYQKDKRVIRQVIYHPLLFAKSKITSETDWRPVRIRYFAVFLPKTKHETKEL